MLRRGILILALSPLFASATCTWCTKSHAAATQAVISSLLRSHAYSLHVSGKILVGLLIQVAIVRSVAMHLFVFDLVQDYARNFRIIIIDQLHRTLNERPRRRAPLDHHHHRVDRS